MKKCPVCLSEHQKKGRFCGRGCGNRDYRARNVEKTREGVRVANRKRYAADPAYRAAHVTQKKKWARGKRAIIGTRTKGFRSQMEERLAPALLAAGAGYETLRFNYPAKSRGYKPDFILPNAVVVEVKGWFPGKDRAKMLAVKQEHPNLDIRIILASPRQFTTQNRTMTQAEWCEKYGFPWAENEVPAAWLSQPGQLSASTALLRGVAVKKAKT